ncbi:MAG: FAD-dependent oxidoreductase [Synergistetes bacterium]|nr:FAD-dependent oxidoreductase [Synergistota bacterium]
MRKTEVLVVGGGPAGLSAAIAAASMGAKVLLVDDGLKLGGQLVKQTHKFFGSHRQSAGVRGIKIAGMLLSDIEKLKDKIEVVSNTTATGYYQDDGVVTAMTGEDVYMKIKSERVIIATGASERMLTFPNNDLPGVYGAGAVQTLMNVYGIVPGDRVLMVGAGNIGLIVSYQLMQANVEVATVVEAMPYIGGYLVHASKIRRLGVPIYTSHTILEVYGKDAVEAAAIVKLDSKWQPIPSTKRILNVDTVCLSVGLSPLIELLWQAGCKMKYVPQLGGNVVLRDKYMRTSRRDIFVAGDVAGIEEATSAMLEGKLAGLIAASDLGYAYDGWEADREDTLSSLEELRRGPLSEKIRSGLKEVVVEW